MYRLCVLMSFVLLAFSVVYGLPYLDACYKPAFGVLLQLFRDNDNYMRVTWWLPACQREAHALWILNLKLK